MSLMPGRGGGDHVERAGRTRAACEMRRMPWSREVLEQGVVGGERAGPDVAPRRPGRRRGDSTTSS